MTDSNTCDQCGKPITVIDGYGFHTCAPALFATSDGGPAFPPMHDPATHASGMTIRDWFAGQAMETLKLEHYFTTSLYGPSHVTTTSVTASQATPEEIARRAYAIADAMLEARKGEKK